MGLQMKRRVKQLYMITDNDKMHLTLNHNRSNYI